MPHVLLATDFSASSDLALTRAIAVAKAHGARLTIGFVDPPSEVPVAPDAEAATIELAGLQREMEAYEDEQLAGRVEQVRAAGIEADAVHRRGQPEEALAALATELDVDLIVCGTHGRTGVRRFFLGSVAERLARLAARPVLVARGAPGDGRFHKVLVATDFEPAATRALEMALDLAPDAAVDVVNSWHYPVGSWGLSALGDRTGAMTALREALTSPSMEQGTRLEEAQRAAGRPVRFRLLHGAAADVITETAAAEGFDLVAVGTHGRQGLRRLVLGSTAEAIIRHAPCSVLVAHAPAR